MFTVICVKCNLPLKVPGAILVGPPYFYEDAIKIASVTKLHLCRDCYKLVIDFIHPNSAD